MKLFEYEWRVIPDFEDYEVTSLGDIRKVKSRFPVAVHLTRTTETVQLTSGGKRYHRTVRSVVLAAFPGALYP